MFDGFPGRIQAAEIVLANSLREVRSQPTKGDDPIVPDPTLRVFGDPDGEQVGVELGVAVLAQPVIIPLVFALKPFLEADCGMFDACCRIGIN